MLADTPWPRGFGAALASVDTFSKGSRTVRNTFALHGSSTQQRPHNERGRSLIQVQVRPTRYWLTADSHSDGKIHQACGKPHQRLAPSSFALLPASVP